MAKGNRVLVTSGVLLHCFFLSALALGNDSHTLFQAQSDSIFFVKAMLYEIKGDSLIIVSVKDKDVFKMKKGFYTVFRNQKKVGSIHIEIPGQFSNARIVQMEARFIAGDRVVLSYGGTAIKKTQSSPPRAQTASSERMPTDKARWSRLSYPDTEGGCYLSLSRIPFLVQPNESYVQLSGLQPPRFLETGLMLRGGLVGWNGIGRINILSAGLWWMGKNFYGFTFEMDFFVEPALVPGIFYFSTGLGGGIAGLLEGRQRWQRPEGQYTDQINRNKGLARSDVAGINYAVGYAGFHIKTSDKFSFAVYLCYYQTANDLNDDWYDAELAKPDAKPEYKIKEEWLEYRVVKTGGVSFQFDVGFGF